MPKVFKSEQGWIVECPACECGHLFDSRWTFNGNLESPTFSPSMLVKGYLGPEKYGTCHSFVRNGKIEFLSDCTHEMAGKTVLLEEV